ncbi:MAG TPA: HepT-like ribonuclease domain-containing protein [Polyangiaceae bacterium]|jgi:uncharacterized protein YutE (UPF0331/DUF86 family)
MTVDPQLVRRKMALVLDDLGRLRGVATKGIDEYLASEVDELVAERLLERIVSRLIDVNYHLWVEAGHSPPRDYRESFLRLAELGVVTAEVAGRHAQSAGLRNRLAHEYDAIDPRLVHEAAGRALADVPELLRSIEAYLGKTGAAGA